MSDVELLRQAAALASAGEPFALATVVRREAPSSARAGQKALIRPDGSLRGWLGGACIEPTVAREAAGALRDGRPRLLLFVPGGEASRPGAAVHPMTCHSGGTVEIYVEPHLPAPVLAVYGDSPVSRALSSMGAVMGYDVWVVGGGEEAGSAPAGARAADRLEPVAPGRPLYAVVATMGAWDEDAVEEALAAGAEYVGLVASPRRAGHVRGHLEERGVGGEALARLASPAGLDIGAREPAEIAVTILAEIIRHRRAGRGSAASADAEGTAPGARADAAPPADSEAAAPAGSEPAPRTGSGVAVDPVCGMTVEVPRSRQTYEHAGTVYYFCCPRCRERFARDPDRWVAA